MKLPLALGTTSRLGDRLAGLTFLRLGLLTLFLGVIQGYYAKLAVSGTSGRVAIATAGVAFVVSAAYAVILRAGWRLGPAAHLQLVTDQLTWTAIVYISGGITSGATSLYGLTCLTGAVVLGLSGAITAALAGITAYMGLAIGFAKGWIPPPSDQPPDAYFLVGAEMVYPVFSTVLAIIVVTGLGSFLAERARAIGGELESAERRVAEAEELAALGRLAAGLAHEIRNPLGSIRGSIELLGTNDALTAEDLRLCQIIEQETQRLNRLVTDMIELSRPRDASLHEIDLALTIRNVVELARNSGRGEEVGVRYEGPRSLVAIADHAQMHQLLWNLVRNAMQASESGAEVVVALALATDGKARMSVSDTGHGIAETQRDRIFEAFFTTRKHGVGIGLALVKKIADSHGFALDVESAKGRGTTICVSIPSRQVIVAAMASLLVGCGGMSWLRSHEEPAELDTVLLTAGAASGEFDAASPGGKPQVGAASAKARPGGKLANDAQSPASSQTGAAPGPPSSSSEVSAAIVIDSASANGLFRNTYYYFPEEPSFPEAGETRQLFDSACRPIRTVSQDFHDRLCVQGSGRLASNATVSFAKRDCECAAACPRTGQRICYELLDARRFPHGRGAAGRAITPFRTVAVDSEVIPLGAAVYIPDYHGLRDPHGKPHDGCFVAEDRGHRVRGRHVDVFVGAAASVEAWNRAVPSNRGVRVLVDASRCGHLARNKR
ncbi:MAG: hypothetical protein EXR75_17015 [Myxococcales bacterium]|nr:hypothetical protein [Myxococcales bacterium]